MICSSVVGASLKFYLRVFFLCYVGWLLEGCVCVCVSVCLSVCLSVFVCGARTMRVRRVCVHACLSVFVCARMFMCWRAFVLERGARSVRVEVKRVFFAMACIFAVTHI